MTALYVGQGVKVTLHFELKLESGDVVDSTFNARPGCFEFGDGTLPAGIETLIHGMKAGERKAFQVPPEQGFGMPNPNNIQRFQRNEFENIESLEAGVVVSFADAANTELAGVITDILSDEVVVDFNHPLAGRTLKFDVEIISLDKRETEVENAN